MGLSTLLSLAPVPVVSEGIRSLAETLLGTRLDARLLLAAWGAATCALAAAAMLAAARRLPRADVSVS
ncbi:MAG TPA: hypothetical protein PKA62_09765, partial [Thermoanaerobaculia bacterium]|nr:hypothetical protein [Thermoanaerobaculia bacterium]